MKVVQKIFFQQDSLKRHSITVKGEVTYCSTCKKPFKTSWHLNRHNAQVHTSQKKVIKPTDPEMFIDFSLLVNYFGDSSDSDDFIPSMVEEDDDSDNRIQNRRYVVFLFYHFSKSFITDSGRIENLSTLVTLLTHIQPHTHRHR